MGFLDSMWDDVVGGPSPPTVSRKRLSVAVPGPSNSLQRGKSLDFPTPASPSLASPSAGFSPGGSGSGSSKHQNNVWRSVFNPSSNKNMAYVGSGRFDKADANSPTVYDWMYHSPQSKPEYR
eukprot:TRINITY_DN63_c0_g1_i1.p2 TRINITY_DN63_c0_g1~~TRINITY_DN63_c0_g1_i1.p2  ORF type:complete len:122 (+),score=16.30 TRINITY_DN63_c0_g1_i1:105-470(+)